jgi:HD superfamily phosphohydrolase
MENEAKNDKKIAIRCPLYGMIEASSRCRRFIDTPEMERLRNILQMANSKYVFPAANHTRFEHSLGVMHLSRKFFDELVGRASAETIADMKKAVARAGLGDLNNISDLIAISGLLHDLGHGPFSHTFDQALKVKHISSNGLVPQFKHEIQSTRLIRRINDREQILSPKEIEFVTTVITCMFNSEDIEQLPRCFFMIVNGDLGSGLDMDKFDYLNRDSHHLGMGLITIDYLMSGAIIDPKTKVIAFDYGAKSDIQAIFNKRQYMYSNVYYHKTIKKIDEIMVCAMLQLDIDTEDLDKFIMYDDAYMLHQIKYVLRHDMFSLLAIRQFHKCDRCPTIIIEKKPTLSSKPDPMDYIIYKTKSTPRKHLLED